MSSQMLSWAVVLVLLLSGCAAQDVDGAVDCYDGPFENAMLDGCTDDCSAFETLHEAELHCNTLEDCNGIVKTAYGDQNAIRLGVGLYEVRRGPEIKDAPGDLMWVKQEVCGQPLGGATDEETNVPLIDAEGQQEHQPLYDQSNDREWVGGISRDNGLQHEWDEDWDEGLDGVAEAYRDVFLNMVMLITFMAILTTCVFISYKMGHEVTVEAVDRISLLPLWSIFKKSSAPLGERASVGPYATL